jgi:hypothetical protein
LKELSELYVVTVGTKSKSQKKSIVKIKTKSLPKNVEEEIIQSIVDSENAFMDYMSLYISEFPQDYLLKRKKRGRKVKVRTLQKKRRSSIPLFMRSYCRKFVKIPNVLTLLNETFLYLVTKFLNHLIKCSKNFAKQRINWGRYETKRFSISDCKSYFQII